MERRHPWKWTKNQVDKGGCSVFYMGHEKLCFTSNHFLPVCFIGALSSL